MLSDDQVARYHEDGFVIPDFRLAVETLDAIRADHQRLLARQPEFRDYCPALLAHDLSFLNYARNPDILDMVEQVIGPDIALWNSSFSAKPAGDGRETPWHQDGEYWPIRPIATCTVWMAIDDATTENGCLRFIAGSHKEKRLREHVTNDDPAYTLNQELAASEYDESDAVDLILEAGQVSLHDVFLVHGSKANISPSPRRGMTLRYMPTTSVYDRDLADQIFATTGTVNHNDRTLYLMRGGDRSGKNDFRIRN